jgi:trimeric autotransporter adhesin
MRSPKITLALLLASLTPGLLLLTPQALLAQYDISTVAGGGPNALAALKTSIGYPGMVARDTAGNTYIADSYASDILKIDTAGNATVVAGNGTVGYSGDGGAATSAALSNPEGLFLDSADNIFIADTGNSLIRVVNTGSTQITIAGTVIPPGDIQTVAGTYYMGNGQDGCVYSGDGGPAASAQLCDPYGVFVDGAGNIFIADTFNEAIREVAATSGTINTVAGNGNFCADPTTPCGDGGAAIAAQLDLPEGVFVDTAGNIFIADTDTNRIRVVNPGTAQITIAGVLIPPGDIQTVAGAYYDSQGGSACIYSNVPQPATSANLCVPANIFVDSSENIFIADTGNQTIREVAVAGTIQTLAGNGTAGYSGDGAAATSAELNYPNSMVVDGVGNIFIADSDNFVIREVASGNIQTVIGNGFASYSGDGGAATDAQLNYPGGVVVDGSGNVLISDSASSVIREVAAASGDIQTLAGTGAECADPTATPACGDGGLASSAQFNNPYAVALDSSGNVYIADTLDNRIRVINTGAAAITIATITIGPSEIATVAGNGTAGYSGDNELATSTELFNPLGVFVDSAGNIFIADTENNRIREVAVSTGIITTVAGTGAQCNPPNATCGDGGVATAANLAFPAGVFVDLSENIYIADSGDNRIREVTASTGNISTVAGTGIPGYAGDGAAAISALLDAPDGVFVDTSGNIFIADTQNSVIRQVVAATGFIATIAGNNTPGFSGDGGVATTAELNTPVALFGNAAGKLFVADTDNSRIRELDVSIFVTVTPNPVSVVVTALQQFTATVTGTGNTAVTWLVNGVAGGNATVGTISATGLFQAPATVPSSPTVTVTALSAADGTTSGSAQATILNPSGTVTVTVSTNPPVTQVYTGTVQAFIATVTPSTNSSVTWYVEGMQGGNSTYGTIDASGNYTGPAAVPAQPNVVIMAVSQADSSAIGTESVMIVTAPGGPQPAPQTVSPGGTATYSISLTPNKGDPRYAITLSCLTSSLPAGAKCNFSPATITPGSSPTPSTLTITVPATAASLEKREGTQPTIYYAFAIVPLAGILLGGARLRKNGRSKKSIYLLLAALVISLLLLNACGGGGSSNQGPSGPVTYNVKIQGTTTAQPNPVTITTATLTVQ